MTFFSLRVEIEPGTYDIGSYRHNQICQVTPMIVGKPKSNMNHRGGWLAQCVSGSAGLSRAGQAVWAGWLGWAG